VTAREARRRRLERAAERLGELERALDETRLALQQQLAANTDLSRRNSDLQALLNAARGQASEKRTLLDAILQSATTLKGMET